MLYLDVFRGPHSTGVCVRNKEGALNTYKEVGLPYNVWLGHPDVFSGAGIVNGDVNLLMGHNRWATKGEVNKDNAHPFTFGHITGCHNGTLSDLDIRALEEGNKFDVDSKVIFRNIELQDIDFVWSKSTGAMALTWWDDIEKSFNLIRNSQRPLHIWQHKECLFWSSDKWVLDDARRAAGCQLRTEIKEISVDQLCTYRIENGKLELDKRPVAPFQWRQSYGGSNNVVGITTRTETGADQPVKDKEVVVRVTTFCEGDARTQGNNSCGYFIAEDVEDPTKQYNVTLWAKSLEASLGLKDEILSRSIKEGKNNYKFKTKLSYNLNGYNHISYNNMSLAHAKPKSTDCRFDKLGTEIYYFDFVTCALENCAYCNTTISNNVWDKLGDYVVMPESGIILCPDCQTDEIIDMCAEHNKMRELDFMRNWS